MKLIPHKSIIIPSNRQRSAKPPEHIVDLANSITRNTLLHPIVVRSNDVGQILLVAGECRLTAMDYAWNMGQTFKCEGQDIPEGMVPCNMLGDLDPIDAYEAELEENIRRADLDWKDKASATAQLFELRRMQAEKAGKPEPTVAQIAEELGKSTAGGSNDEVRKQILVSRHLEDPDVAKAGSTKEAFKILKRKEELKKSAELSERVGKTFSASDHTLLRGDCTSIMRSLPDASFDVILTDPPYGIDAQDFGNSDGKTPGAHFYDDSPASFRQLMSVFVPETFRVTKPQAHLYLFCDIEWFIQLRVMFVTAGWQVFRTPLIWVNPTAMRLPWVDSGPQRKWQMILYAIKGSKPVTQVFPDVITVPSDVNLNHHAQKPVALYRDLLSRSARAGDSVLDPFCGSGPIFPAAHHHKCKATGIEIDPAAAGIAAQRLKELK